MAYGPVFPSGGEVDKYKIAACLGIVLSTAGTLLVFVFGIPKRQRSEGREFMAGVVERRKPIADPREEARNERFGRAGIACMVLGAFLQVISIIATM